jgi:hypothetical protein
MAVHRDEGISGAKDRQQRPGLDAMMKGVTRREYDLVAAWSVRRLPFRIASVKTTPSSPIVRPATPRRSRTIDSPRGLVLTLADVIPGAIECIIASTSSGVATATVVRLGIGLIWLAIRPPPPKERGRPGRHGQEIGKQTSKNGFRSLLRRPNHSPELQA